MGYHPRIESKTLCSFLTTRSRNSELWFRNNDKLESAALGYCAKFSHRYGVKLYGLAIEGNHIQGAASFPNANRSFYMRDVNSCVARAVKRLTVQYPGGKFWGRRYSCEFLPGDADIEDRFFYLALQPVNDGLVERLSDYPGYKFFHDAIWGRTRKYSVVRWKEFNAARKRKPGTPIKDYTDEVDLKYERLPGYEELSQEDYAKLMMEKLEVRRLEIVNKRRAEGKGFLGPEKLRKTKTGSLPRSTKTSTIGSHRPRVLSVCPERRAECLAWYFSVYKSYREASEKFRMGDLTIEFPEGTYRPYTPYRDLHPPP